jgi:hypothetical protein
LYRSHDITGSGTDHREAKDAIIAVANKSFHKTLSLVGRLRAKDGVHWQACNAGYHTLAFRFALAQPDAGERGIDEHAIWHQTIARASISAREIVAYVRVPSSLSFTTRVFGATKRPLPMINSAPLAL